MVKRTRILVSLKFRTVYLKFIFDYIEFYLDMWYNKCNWR